MLKLIYTPTPAGAPDQYRDVIDTLAVREATGDRIVQSFLKSDPGFAAPTEDLGRSIDEWLAQRGGSTSPVIVMVHGYMYDPRSTPGTDSSSPFGTVYGVPSAAIPYHLSWLPLVGECKEDGSDPAETAIAYSYKSEASVAEFNRAGWSNSYQYAVFDLAPLAARGLATLLYHLGTKGDSLKVRVLAHSLGTRTISQAIRLLRARMPANLDRIVLLDGAEFCVDAAANFAGYAFDVINIANRADTVLKVGADQMCHPMRAVGALESCVIGRDGLGDNERWLDLQLDSDALVTWFASRNAPDGGAYTIGALAEEESHPAAWLDHWSCYTNDGNRRLVSDLLSSDVMTIAALMSHGVPAGTNSPSFGRFRDQPVPVAPSKMLERRRMLAQAFAESTTGVG